MLVSPIHLLNRFSYLSKKGKKAFLQRLGLADATPFRLVLGILAGEVGVVRAALQKSPALLNATDVANEKFLHFLGEEGLRYGLPMGRLSGFTPLGMALVANQSRVVDWLLRQPGINSGQAMAAPEEFQKGPPRTPFDLALQYGRAEDGVRMVELLCAADPTGPWRVSFEQESAFSTMLCIFMAASTCSVPPERHQTWLGMLRAVVKTGLPSGIPVGLGRVGELGRTCYWGEFPFPDEVRLNEFLAKELGIHRSTVARTLFAWLLRENACPPGFSPLLHSRAPDLLALDEKERLESRIVEAKTRLPAPVPRRL
jgi:hypothetical protein